MSGDGNAVAFCKGSADTHRGISHTVIYRNGTVMNTHGELLLARALASNAVFGDVDTGFWACKTALNYDGSIFLTAVSGVDTNDDTTLRTKVRLYRIHDSVERVYEPETVHEGEGLCGLEIALSSTSEIKASPINSDIMYADATFAYTGHTLTDTLVMDWGDNNHMGQFSKFGSAGFQEAQGKKVSDISMSSDGKNLAVGMTYAESQTVKHRCLFESGPQPERRSLEAGSGSDDSGSRHRREETTLSEVQLWGVPTAEDDSDDDSLSTGAIIGISVGSVAGVGAIAGFAWYFGAFSTSGGYTSINSKPLYV